MTFRYIKRKREREGKSYHVSEGVRMCLATNKNFDSTKYNSEDTAGKEEGKKIISWQRREKENESAIWEWTGRERHIHWVKMTKA